MRAVVKKAAADLLGRPWQSLLILLTLAAASSLLYLGLAVLSASSGPYERLHARANGAHAWFYLVGGEGGQALSARIAGMPEVIETSPTYPRWQTKLILADERTPRVDLAALPAGARAVDRYLIAEGRELRAEDRDGAVIDASYARFHKLRVGDRVQVATPSGGSALTVVGLHAEPRICLYPSCQGINLYVLPETFSTLTNGAREVHLAMGVRLQDPATADKFIAAAKKLESGDAKVVVGLSWLRIRSVYSSEQALAVALILIVGVTAIIAAALITANVIGGAVLGQYREIGILKAVGYTPLQVLLLFVGANLLLAVAGGAAGVGAGHLLARRMLAAQAFNMADPGLLLFRWGYGGLVLAGVGLIAALFAGLSAWRAVTVRPCAALSGGVDTPVGRSPLPVRWITALRLPVPVLLGVKDATARPGRLILTVVSLGVCLVTTAISFGTQSLVDSALKDPAIVGINYDLRITPGLMTAEAAERAVAAGEGEGVATYYSMAFRTAAIPAVDDTFYLRGVGGDIGRFSFPITHGRMFEGPGELVLGRTLVTRHGLQLGQELVIQIEGRERTVRLVGIYRSPDEGGATGLVSLETMNSLVPDLKPEAFFAAVAPGQSAEAVRQALLRSTGYQIDPVVAKLEIPPWLTDALAMVKVLAALMAGIAVLSVLNTALLTAREQMREAGIRKAVGMTPAQIAASAATGGLWVGLLGGALGVPGGAYVYRLLVDAMGEITGIGQLDNVLATSYLVLLLGISVGLAVAASLPAAIWAGRLSTARVLYAQ